MARREETLRWLEWDPTGPALNSFEDTSSGGTGPLTVDYAQNVDTRFGVACLGPLTNTVTLTAAGGTGTTAIGFAMSGTMNATLFGYVIRGTKWAKVQISNMTLISDGTETALAEAATSIVYTKNAAGTPVQVIAIGMDNTAYRCITAVGAGTTDTHSANNESIINRIMALATPSGTYQRMVGLGRSGAANTGMNTVRYNILSTTVDADASAWGTTATISGKDITFTGFGLDENFWILGTDEGPFYLDSEFATFRELMPEIGRNASNCVGMGRWSYLGLLIPLLRGLRPQKGLQSYGAVGPERYANNTSPVQGRVQGVTGDEQWAYLPVYNIVTGDTYLCAVRPRQPEDWHNNLLSYYPIAWYQTTVVGFIEDIDTANGTRTSPTTVLGLGTDMGYITRGAIPREIDDTNYRFAASGTEFLTETRRDLDVVKDVQLVTLTTTGCSATQTVTVKLQVEDILTGALRTAITVGAPIASNGFHVLRIPEQDPVSGTRVKPQLVFATASSSASPQVIGKVRVGYHATELLDRENRSVA